MPLGIDVQVQAHRLLGLHQPRQKTAQRFWRSLLCCHAGEHMAIKVQQINGLIVKGGTQQCEPLQDGR